MRGLGSSWGQGIYKFSVAHDVSSPPTLTPTGGPIDLSSGVLISHLMVRDAKPVKESLAVFPGGDRGDDAHGESGVHGELHFVLFWVGLLGE